MHVIDCLVSWDLLILNMFSFVCTFIFIYFPWLCAIYVFTFVRVYVYIVLLHALDFWCLVYKCVHAHTVLYVCILFNFIHVFYVLWCALLGAHLLFIMFNIYVRSMYFHVCGFMSHYFVACILCWMFSWYAHVQTQCVVYMCILCIIMIYFTYVLYDCASHCYYVCYCLLIRCLKYHYSFNCVLCCFMCYVYSVLLWYKFVSFVFMCYFLLLNCVCLCLFNLLMCLFHDSVFIVLLYVIGFNIVYAY